MDRKLVTLLCAVLVLCLSTAATLGAEPTVEARGLRIVGKGYAAEPDMTRPFNWSPGTTISALVVLPKGGLISVVDKESKLTHYADNKGTDLLKAKGKFSRPRISANSFNISKDKKACVIEIQSPGLPAKGIVTFKTGSTKKTFTQKNIAVKAGTKIDAGPVKFTILKTGKPQWGNAPLSVTLKATQDISNIDKMRFLDAAGKVIKTSGGGTMTSRNFGNFNVEKNILFPAKATSFTIEITYWMDAKTVKVPFKLTTSLGM
jgi:hypothetical protein